MIAALATAPAMAAPAGKTDQDKRTPKSECSLETPAKTKTGSRTKPQARPMDCIVVRGYPSQDGRATLRRSLQEDAKDGLSKVVRPSLKDLFGKGRTS